MDKETSLDKWMKEERRKVIDYLAAEGCRHAGVADWPAFHVEGHLALWAIQSTRHSGRVGWWAISGDVPIDYMSSGDGDHPRDALKFFAAQWSDVAGCLRRGEPHPEIDFGDPAQWPELAETLERQALLLEDYADAPSIWVS